MNNRNNKRRNNRSSRKGPKPKDSRDNRQNQSGSGSSSGTKAISGIRSVSTNVTKEKSSRASVTTNTSNSSNSSVNRQKEQKPSRDRKNRRDRRESKEAREARERANKKKNILKKLNILNKSTGKPAAKRRGGAGRFKGGPRKKIVLYKVSPTKSSTCPICSKIIKNMNNALVDEPSGQPAHFDCVFEAIKKSLNPGKGQRVVYVGTGGFALIEDVRENGRDKFKIVEKVQYNNKKTVK